MLSPNQDRILFKKIEMEIKSAGGLILSGTEVKDNRDLGWGQVIAVGPGKVVDTGERVVPTAKPGDIIGFNDRQPIRFHYGGEYLYLIRDGDVLITNSDENISIKPFSEIDESEFKKSPQYIGPR